MRADSTLPGWPRVLRREQAAAYVGLGVSLFDGEVKAGRIPAPVPIAATVRAWVRDDLDAWIDDRRAAQSSVPEPNPWSELE